MLSFVSFWYFLISFIYEKFLFIISIKEFYNAFKDKNSKDSAVHRYFVAISPWSWGHFLQVHDNMISHWTPGDVIEIPNEVFHLSANFGIETKLTLTVTGYRQC